MHSPDTASTKRHMLTRRASINFDAATSRLSQFTVADTIFAISPFSLLLLLFASSVLASLCNLIPFLPQGVNASHHSLTCYFLNLLYPLLPSFICCLCQFPFLFPPILLLTSLYSHLLFNPPFLFISSRCLISSLPSLPLLSFFHLYPSLLPFLFPVLPFIFPAPCSFIFSCSYPSLPPKSNLSSSNSPGYLSTSFLSTLSTLACIRYTERKCASNVREGGGGTLCVGGTRVRL